MCEKIEFEGKTKEEAIQNCLNDLKLAEQDIVIVDCEEKNSLFKGKKITIKVLKKDDIKIYIKNFVNELSKYMNISITSEIIENDNTYNVTLVSDNNAIL